MRVWCRRKHGGLPSRGRGFEARHALHRRRGQAGGSSLSSMNVPGNEEMGRALRTQCGSFPPGPCGGRGTMDNQAGSRWRQIPYAGERCGRLIAAPTRCEAFMWVHTARREAEQKY